MLLPHKLFGVMYENDKAIFEQFFFGTKDRLRSFWKSLCGTKIGQHDAIREVQNYGSTCIPLKVFGDGVACVGLAKSWGKSLNVVSMQGVLNKEQTCKAHAILATWWKKRETPDSLALVWRVLAWSFEQLYRGKWPSTDWKGNPFKEGTLDHERAGSALAGPYWGALIALTGDMEWLHQGYGLNAHNSTSPCSFCACTSTEPPWTDIRPEAEWRSQVWTNDLWSTCHTAIPLLELPTTGIESVFYDIMHTKHLGTDAYGLGSWIHFMVSEKHIPLATLWGHIANKYKALGVCKFHEITQNMYYQRDAKYPCLKGK
eukprot:2411319-Amphidinium_carterae.1